MADKEIHLKQALHNEALSRELSGPSTYKDWSITTAFYSAIHYAEAALATMGEHVKREKGGHSHRRRLCKRYFQNIVIDLEELKDASENVRYLLEPEKSAIEYYSDEDINYFLGTLDEIKRKLETRLKLTG